MNSQIQGVGGKGPTVRERKTMLNYAPSKATFRDKEANERSARYGKRYRPYRSARLLLRNVCMPISRDLRASERSENAYTRIVGESDNG